MNILVLTGAGISAESGIPTFRDANGLWEGHRFEDVATPEAFERNPTLVHDFYNQRRRSLQSEHVQPNAAHLALANFEHQLLKSSRGSFLLVTQNIDGLHQRAGSQNVLAMHGDLQTARCMDTGKLYPWKGDLDEQTPHPDSEPASVQEEPCRRGRLRPHVVWFGEMPLGLEQIEAAASTADYFVAIGTSAVVYPAAGIVHATPKHCKRVEINLENTPQSDQFDASIRGPASQTVPEFFSTLLDSCDETR